MSAISMGTNFPAKVVESMFNAVRGKSTVAKFTPNAPIAFTGNNVFTFAMDKELAIVAENEAKSEGGATATPVTIQPIKVEYGARVSDEFMFASEEEQLNILETFAEGFAAKIARGLDIMAMHGKNPRTGAVSPLVKTYIDKASTAVTKGSKSASEALEEAVAALGDYDVTGVAVNKSFAAELAKSVTNGVKDYPDFRAWGSVESSINGVPADVNSTVSTDLAIVGDWSALKWGYGREVEMEVIRYGCPDNDAEAGDLRGHNQVYIRGEAYIGIGVLDPAAFAIVK